MLGESTRGLNVLSNGTLPTAALARESLCLARVEVLSQYMHARTSKLSRCRFYTEARILLPK